MGRSRGGRVFEFLFRRITGSNFRKNQIGVRVMPKTTEQGKAMTELEDREVREMLIKAGFDVTINDDVASFSRLMRYLLTWHEKQIQNSVTKRTWVIAAVTAAITTMIPIILHHLKVM